MTLDQSLALLAPLRRLCRTRWDPHEWEASGRVGGRRWGGGGMEKCWRPARPRGGCGGRAGRPQGSRRSPGGRKGGRAVGLAREEARSAALSPSQRSPGGGGAGLTPPQAGKWSPKTERDVDETGLGRVRKPRGPPRFAPGPRSLGRGRSAGGRAPGHPEEQEELAAWAVGAPLPGAGELEAAARGWSGWGRPPRPSAGGRACSPALGGTLGGGRLREGGRGGGRG